MLARSSRPQVRLFGLAALLLGAVLLPPPATAAPGGPVPAPVQVPAAPLGPGSSHDLTESTWLWQRTERSDGTTTVAQDPARYTVTFLPAGQLSIQADCNRVAGSYEREASRLTLQLGPSTLVGCPPGSQADAFLAGLGAVGTYLFSGPNLVLNLKLDSGNMIFAPRPNVALAGTRWKLQVVNNGRQAVVSVLLGTEITAIFGSDGVVSGSAGCNSYSGTYTVAGDSIRFGPLATTRMACGPPIMEQEQAYLTALQAATRYTLAGDQLILQDGTGARQAAYIAAGPAPSRPGG